MNLLDRITPIFAKAPLSVTVALCGACNGKCLYCKIRELTPAPMPLDKTLALLDELKSLGTMRIGFTQDEPLLYDDLGAVLKSARKNFSMVTLGSNGVLVPEKIDELAGNLDSLILPLDGMPETHDTHRGKGMYKAVTEACKAAASADIPIWFTCVLAKDNIDQVEDILRLAKALGGKIHFQPLYHDPHISGDTSDMLPGNDDLKLALAKIIAAKRHGEPILNSLPSLETMLSWPDYSKPRLDEYSAERIKLPECSGGKLFAHINSKGDLYTCTEEVGESFNVFELGAKEAFTRLRDSSKVCKYSCLGSDYLEYNLLASGRPRSLLHAARILLAR